MLAEIALIGAAALSGEFVDYKWRNDVPPGWERFTMALTNETEADKTVRVCPADVQMVLQRPGTPHRNSFAVAFDDANWRFNCTQRALAPGESTQASFYFRTTGLFGLSREVKVKTNLGEFVMNGGNKGRVQRPVNRQSVTTAG